MTPRKFFMAIAAVGLLAVAGLATSVAAQPGPHSSGRADEMRDRAEDRRDRAEDARDRAEDFRDHFEDRCGEDAAALNASEQAQCMRVRGFFLNATQARRESAALFGAVAALERNIGRLEVREVHLEQQLAAGNFTGNETAASIEAALATIEDAQERLVERLDALALRLSALHEKWQAVRDHVEERRHGGDDDLEDEADEDDDEAEHDDSSSSSSSPPA